jgi:NADP-reducing hydrogenase subunit HndB
MSAIKSLEDLKRIREEALKKRQIKQSEGQIQIVVGMGTPGIAAGARDTMKAILEFIETEKLTGVDIRQTGNIGLDSYEPIVQITVGDAPRISYGRVSPEIARRILKEHVQGGVPVREYIIESAG